jgi:hypothetical protein
MELASLFLLVLLPPSDATGDTGAAIETALHRELGDVPMAIAPDTLITPLMWKGDKAPMRARFVVHVSWKEKEKASVEVFSPTSTTGKPIMQSSRQMSFAPQDSKAERGRAVGLVIAELLRESPALATMIVRPGTSDNAVGSPHPSHLVLGGMFGLEQTRAGHWAWGPELTYGFFLRPTLQLRASAMVLFGSEDQYIDTGADVGIGWDFLYSAGGKHALGLAAEVGVFRESADRMAERDRNASKWDLSLAVGIYSYFTVWRSLRIVAELGFRVKSSSITVNVGDEFDRWQHEYSIFRPVAAIGLGFAM